MPAAPAYRRSSLLRPLSPKTEHDYHKVLVRAYGPPGNPIDPPNMRELAHWTESTRKVLRAAIKSWYAHAGDPEKGITYAERIPHLYVVRKKVQYPTEEEMQRFEAGITDPSIRARFRPLLTMLVRVGFRAKELLMLSREQIERAISTGELFFEGKGGEEGSMPVLHVAPELHDLLASAAALPHATEKMRLLMLEHPAGVPRWETVGEILAAPGASFETRYNLLARLVKRVARLAELDPALWSPHKLRHGFASRMNRDGAPVATIQKALRHKNVLTTMKYIHANTADVDKFMRRGAP